MITNRTQYNVAVRGCVELQQVALHCGFAERGTGLKSLAKTLLQWRLNKSNHLRCSNWNAATLSAAQVEYAALDAWVRLSDSLLCLDHPFIDFLLSFNLLIYFKVGERLFMQMFKSSHEREAQSLAILDWAKKWVDQVRFRPPRQKRLQDNGYDSFENRSSRKKGNDGERWEPSKEHPWRTPHRRTGAFAAVLFC